jgi:ParB family chromosome partitioning protein
MQALSETSTVEATSTEVIHTVAAASSAKRAQRAAAELREPPEPGSRGLYRLGDLVATPLNIRTDPRTPEDVRAMAQSILFHGGILQNLVLLPMLDDKGQWTGKLGAVAGETRRLALCLLRDGGIPEAEGFTDEYLVPGTIVAAPEARAASLTENAIRTPLSPADQFIAFKALVDEGGDIEQIAAMYGVEPIVVERRLRLANASPKLFQVYREGGMELEQLMALCVSDDHARQEKVWKAVPHWQRSAHHLRSLLTQDHVSLTADSVGRFVGAAAYEAAGGTVLRDLFAEDDEGFVADKVLLQQLAHDKLEAIAAKVRGEGWAWVESRTQFDRAERAGFTQCPLTRRKLGAEDAKLVRDLGEQLQALQARIRKGDDSAATRQQCKTLQAQVAAVEGGRCTVAEASRPFAGAIVCIDHAGNVEVVRGIVKPEDRKAHAKALKQAEQRAQSERQGREQGADGSGKDDLTAAAQRRGDGAAEQQASSEAGSEISRPLSLRLGAQRTAALQVLLARNTSLALACLAQTLVSDVFHLGCAGGHDPLQISAHPVRGETLARSDATVQGAKACIEFSEILQAWEARMPQDSDALLPWLMALPGGELAQLIGVCVAASTTTVPFQAIEAKPLWGHQAAVARAAGLDMTQWWEPTAMSYLANVSKAQVIGVVRDVVGAQACVGLDKLPKPEVVAKAESLLQGKRWLPDLLKLATGEQA